VPAAADVANGVSEGIVDLFEAIEVDKQPRVPA
jgi:hypothetical protein